MKISVVLCTYNRASSLRTVLEMLAHQELGNDVEFELVVVDNNSTDSTRAVVELFQQDFPDLDIQYYFEATQGKSYALNAGIRAASHEVLAFTDDDVVIDPCWLRSISEAFNALPTRVLAGRVRPLWMSSKPAWMNELESRLYTAIVEFDMGEKPLKLDEPGIGANMAVHSDVFDEFGAFRTDIGPTSGELMRCEDTEIFQRLISSGEPVYYSPEMIIDHPVEEFRMTREYFLKYYFAYGRSRTRISGVEPVTLFFGVPRYMLRQVLSQICRWLSTISVSERFLRKLELAEQLGVIFESRRISSEVASTR